MRSINFLLLSAIITIFAASLTFSQVRPPVPRASQKASVSQTVGTTEISVIYSRPAVRDRKVWGDWPQPAEGEATLDNQNTRPEGAPLVPFGHVWRAGANEATLFSAADDVLINGELLPAGKYSFHAIPGKDEWILIFNKDDGQWGSFSYDKAKDALRVKTKPQSVSESAELLTYGFEKVGDRSATLFLQWEKVKVPFTVEVKDVVGSTMQRLRSYVAAADASDPVPLINAANYAKANKQAEQAAVWFTAALKLVDQQIAAKPSFAALTRKGNILIGLDRTADAIAVFETAVERGKLDGVNAADVAALEKRIASLKTEKP